MSAQILEVRGLVKRFGGLIATDSLDLTVAASEVHALIGPNGAGKTTLIGQLAGELRPDAGSIRFDGRDVTGLEVHQRALAGLARSYQITQVVPDFTALENVMLAVQAHAGHSFRFWRPARAGTVSAEMAHGEHRQLELAMALAGRPKLLLLDEPLAGMSRQENGEMIELLARLKGRYSMLLVEHDMDAVFALADRITVMVYGRIIASGAPEAIRADAEVRRAYLGEAVR